MLQIRSRQRRAGTLLEVLVSLVIITLVASSFIEIAAQRRRAMAEARRQQIGMDLAMAWRTARFMGQDWAKGKEGSFPGHDDVVRWLLEATPAATTSGSVRPDDSWMRLIIALDNNNSAERVSYVVRLSDRVAAAAGGNQQ